MKKGRVFAVLFIVCLFAAVNLYAEDMVVKGKVTEVAEDESYVVVDGTRVLTPEEFLEYNYLEVDDEVEITAEKTGENLVAKECEFMFEDYLYEGDNEYNDEYGSDDYDDTPVGENIAE